MLRPKRKANRCPGRLIRSARRAIWKAREKELAVTSGSKNPGQALKTLRKFERRPPKNARCNILAQIVAGYRKWP
jgi:hypothetical protein